MAHHDNSHNRSTDSEAQDPTFMTIEFLRARLLAERAVSKNARAKLDGLADKVAELEEQLKIVSLQRKKAEQATVDVLAILEENGFTDVSDGYDSNSDHESYSQTNSVSGKSISWKGRRRESGSSDKIKESRYRRHRGFESAYFSSPRHCQGRSCRKIRHNESRTVSEDNKRDGNPVDLQENGVQTEVLSQTSEEASRTVVKEDESLKKLSNSNGLKKENSMDINLARALKNRANVVGSFEDLEETQKEWEKKFKENKSSALDLCDVGNHSDVTDESSGKIAQTQLQGSTVVPSLHDPRSIANEVMESFETLSSDKCCKSCGSKSIEEDASFSGDNGIHIPEFPHLQSYKGISEDSSSTIQSARTNLRVDYPLVLVVKEKSDTCDSVLTALKQAKLSLQKKVNSLHIGKPEYLSESSCPSTPSPYMNINALPIEPAAFGTTSSLRSSSIGPMVEFPVGGCAELFRVPTDFSPDASRRNNFLASSSQKALVSHIPAEHRDQLPTKTLLNIGFQNQLLDTSLDRLLTTPYIGGPKLWAGFRADGQPMVDAQEYRPSVSDSVKSLTSFNLDRQVSSSMRSTGSLYRDSVLLSREMYSTPYYTRLVGLPPTGGSDDRLI